MRRAFHDPGEETFGATVELVAAGRDYQLLTQTGHLPQIETPQMLIDVVWAFADRGWRQRSDEL